MALQTPAQKAHYQRNREKILAANKARREKLRDLIRAAKAKPCADCGIEYPYYVMQFDHRRGDKEFTIAGYAAAGKGRLQILAEINKCDVVCANCHAERTHGPGSSNGQDTTLTS